jgi:hypothetical protein
MVKLTRKKFTPKSFIGLAAGVYPLNINCSKARTF